MKVVKPIFIVGTGRCGSTAFHRTLAVHPQLMWLSGFAEHFPFRPEWNRWAVTAVGNRTIRRIFRKRIKPGENYRFWYKHAFGFAEPGRDLVRSDVTPRVKKQMHAAFEPMLTPKRSRLLIKLTGWSRMGFLDEVFPDARFIHIVRDGRAVASSHLHINEWQWRGWYGPYSWRYGPLSAEDQATWEASGRSYVALAHPVEDPLPGDRDGPGRPRRPGKVPAGQIRGFLRPAAGDLPAGAGFRGARKPRRLHSRRGAHDDPRHDAAVAEGPEPRATGSADQCAAGRSAAIRLRRLVAEALSAAALVTAPSPVPRLPRPGRPVEGPVEPAPRRLGHRPLERAGCSGRVAVLLHVAAQAVEERRVAHALVQPPERVHATR